MRRDQDPLAPARPGHGQPARAPGLGDIAQRSVALPRHTMSYRVAGHGRRPVVLVHASASAPAQWRRLMGCAAPDAARLRMYAPALPGYARSERLGAGTPPPDDDVQALGDFVDTIGAGVPVDLIGHSYGGAIATEVALRRPHRVANLTLIEPVLFNVLAQSGQDARFAAVASFARAQIEAVATGDLEGAARDFVDHWSGPTAWPALAPPAQAAVTAAMPKVAREWQSLWQMHTDLKALARLAAPVRLLWGECTTPAMRALMQALHERLPSARLHGIAGAGHLAPVTHGDAVNALLLAPLRDGGC